MLWFSFVGWLPGGVGVESLRCVYAYGEERFAKSLHEWKSNFQQYDSLDFLLRINVLRLQVELCIW